MRVMIALNRSSRFNDAMVLPATAGLETKMLRVSKERLSTGVRHPHPLTKSLYRFLEIFLTTHYDDDVPYLEVGAPIDKAQAGRP